MKIDLSQYRYAPTLKWKEGEYRGVQGMPESEKNEILPIFLMPPAGSFDNEDGKVLSPDEHIKSFGARISAAWPGRLCFIDAGQVDTNDYAAATGGAHPLLALFERARMYAPRAICAPATALDRTLGYQAAVAGILQKYPELPCCVRLRPEDLEGGDINELINTLLASIGVQPERVVLVLDAAELDISDPKIFAELMANMINTLPHLYRWKVLVTALCALPEVVKAPPNKTTKFPRTDWQVFRSLAEMADSGALLRRPIYSDYCTENTTFLPAAPVRPATQLRYTSETEIAIHKGENTKTAGYEGIYPVAVRVMSDGDFAGGNFSAGDLAIETLATRPKSPGNASSWKKHGVIHHLTLVLAQLRQLAGISRVQAKVGDSDVEENQSDLLDMFTEDR